jgi:phage tail-like protein
MVSSLPRVEVELPAVPPEVTIPDYPESIYLQYLPAIYRQEPFINRLLLIFESILVPLERVVGLLPFYTEPEMTPEAFLPWLAHWVALTLDSTWPVDRQRALIAHAAEIYRWRGTRRGLKLHLWAYTGTVPLIQEYHGGFVIGRENGLSWTTRLVTGPTQPFLFVVTVPVPNPEGIDPQVMHAIITEDKPAHTTYDLRVVRCTGCQPQRPPDS